jgi:hypothetical protein
MRQAFLVMIVLTSSWCLAQDCTSYVVFAAYDRTTGVEIETLKTEDFEATMGKTTLPVVTSSQHFTNRLLVLLETDGIGKDDKLADEVDMVTRMARQAPEGISVAFGVFAERAVFTKGFVADPQKRDAAMSDVVEKKDSLGTRVALWDALHQALALFGPHQPGDTVLLVSDVYDDKSSRSGSDVEKELIARGIRLYAMRRRPASLVDRDFIRNSHELEKTVLERTIKETGGVYSEFSAALFRFAWQGYMLGIKVPGGLSKPHKWKMQFRGPAADVHPKANLYYPEQLPPCSATTAAH